MNKQLQLRKEYLIYEAFVHMAWAQEVLKVRRKELDEKYPMPKIHKNPWYKSIYNKYFRKLEPLGQ